MSAVERIDDPGAVGAEAASVVSAFFRHHDVGGPLLAEQPNQQIVGQTVTVVPKPPRVETAGPRTLPQLGERDSGLVGQIGRQAVIV